MTIYEEKKELSIELNTKSKLCLGFLSKAIVSQSIPPGSTGYVEYIRIRNLSDKENKIIIHEIREDDKEEDILTRNLKDLYIDILEPKEISETPKHQQGGKEFYIFKVKPYNKILIEFKENALIHIIYRII